MRKSRTARLARILRRIGPVNPQSPIGVLDIGSNSVRLVGYSGSTRTPLPIFNERAFCRLGISVTATGRIGGAYYTHAMATFSRFRAIADQLGIKKLAVFATAAVRDAENREAFTLAAEKILKAPVRVLAGEEEAQLSARGVMHAIPHVHGLVADLGGGSLELAHVENSTVVKSTTLPLGVLTVSETCRANPSKMSSMIKTHLKEVDWLSEVRDQQLYMVGGAWRNLMRVRMAHIGYELDVLHQYRVPTSGGIKAFLTSMAKAEKQNTFDLTQASRSRREALPVAAKILRILCDFAAPESLIVSSTGVREGVLFSMLKDKDRAVDPLLLACEEMAERMCKSADYGHELGMWTDHIFSESDQSPDNDRYRVAACLVSDIAWSMHPNSRAELASGLVLKAPFNGICHRGRLLMAYALAYRHEINEDPIILGHLPMHAEAARLGKMLGLAFRLAHSLSASLPGILKQTSLKRKGNRLVLDMRHTRQDLYAPIIENRLAKLSQAMGLQAEIRR